MHTTPFPIDLSEVRSHLPALPFGFTADGTAVFDPSDEPHLVIDGRDREANISTVKVLVAAAGTADDLCFGIIAGPIARPSGFDSFASDLDSADDLLQQVVIEIIDRTAHASQPKHGHAKAQPRLYLFVDELANLHVSNPRAETPIYEAQRRESYVRTIDVIAAEGPSVGVHVILTTEHLDTTSLEFRDLSGRLHIDDDGFANFNGVDVTLWDAPAI